MITHSIYASIVPVAIALAIIFALFVVATIFERTRQLKGGGCS